MEKLNMRGKLKYMNQLGNKKCGQDGFTKKLSQLDQNKSLTNPFLIPILTKLATAAVEQHTGCLLTGIHLHLTTSGFC